MNKPTTPTTPSEQLKADESKDACRDPSLVRSERLEFTDSSAGGDVALHDCVLMLKAMAWGARSARRALRAQSVDFHVQAHDAVGAVEGR